MDIIDFIEKELGMRLAAWQKEYIRKLEKLCKENGKLYVRIARHNGKPLALPYIYENKGGIYESFS